MVISVAFDLRWKLLNFPIISLFTAGCSMNCDSNHYYPKPTEKRIINFIVANNTLDRKIELAIIKINL